MPVIFRYKGYKFFFFSNEGDPREFMHVHVRKGSAVAKFWIEPELSIDHSYGMSSKELGELIAVVRKNLRLIARSWHEYFKK